MIGVLLVNIMTDSKTFTKRRTPQWLKQSHIACYKPLNNGISIPSKPTIKHLCIYFNVNELPCDFHGCNEVAISVHHIIPNRRLSRRQRLVNNELWNLFPVCEKHHLFFEEGAVDARRHEWTTGEERMLRHLKYLKGQQGTNFRYDKSLRKLGVLKKRSKKWMSVLVDICPDINKRF